MRHENSRVRVTLKWYTLGTETLVGEEESYTEDYPDASQAAGFNGFSLDSLWAGDTDFPLEDQTIPDDWFKHKILRDKYRYIIGFYSS